MKFYYYIPERGKAGKTHEILLQRRHAGKIDYDAIWNAFTGKRRIIPYRRDLLNGLKVKR